MSKLFVLYDSIYNSVFESQVLDPLRFSTKRVHIISFEPQRSTHWTKISLPAHVQLHIIKRAPYICQLLLYHHAIALRTLLSKLSISSIVARGPIAGYITMRALNNSSLPLTIQARGLLAEEYIYATPPDNNPFKRIYRYLRAQSYKRIERNTFKSSISKNHITIEAISNNLRKYIHTQYNIPLRKITIAANDIPRPIDRAQQKHNRTHIRQKLSLDLNAYVIAYCGSAKEWQCPEKMISFIKKESTKNSALHFLILSQDTVRFNELCLKLGLLANQYTTMCISANKVTTYLCAADCGILFRKKHIINDVARPTKLLEYYAAGLPVIFNGKKMLSDRSFLTGTSL